MRLDKYLMDEGYFESRNRAHEAIKAGQVRVDGKVAKPSANIDENTVVEVEDAKFYVSRAARKLESFLAAYALEVKGKRTLDIGSSTGGFAQILLEHDVGALTCVDVGKDQLHISLRDNAKLSLFEETDIRDFEAAEPFELITCDVSFISVLQISDAIDRLSAQGTDIIILYKPQFEVGKEVKRDAKGVVQDKDAIARRKEAFEAQAENMGWEEMYQTLSHIQGKEGNQEYLYHFVKSGR
ncbi:MAG TPA: TlyA family RNA methyltransferase [Sulfurovum sp.]|nr:MAG: TlyA family rRNA (cytidine-2'-O)-methyltransferase [Sulfurovum sp. 35-42-20]OYZ25322.1 MAG: TlyA family rRNA (cytidine-2'-O)-methyltransferase [Sulfurovum sp. 16-42-52]OYZ49072.1 MAG: TlyA family rRNA (cytidine-2'-O)-methyltransferase [Sulfurovum sp. 24-42-9]OZA46839.1 MAG: TlyA family rRNA (cytidine-2'-O)-methyltransferase [Sulfurovum sp. 17-42-90]OZA59182.1 MAG: TlyA family rRNA (cytidine-2'-O)-methyltransferase [Sulfurovum sp. 39-42-12]HQR74757.1 TlyA family RNA methyltransferase [S